MEILVFFLLLEILVLHIWLHCPLLGFTIGLPVWLFSISLVQNVVISLQSSAPPTEQNQPPVDLKVDPLPYSSFVSSSPSSSSLGESIGTSKQVAKKKKKGKKKKKKKIQ